jgi:hypothetical protein
MSFFYQPTMFPRNMRLNKDNFRHNTTNSMNQRLNPVSQYRGSILVEVKLQVSVNQSLASCNYSLENENLWPKGLDMIGKSSVNSQMLDGKPGITIPMA